MNEPGNVVDLPGSTHPLRHGGSSGNGGSFGERLARVEAHIAHLATKEDVSKVETLIERKVSSMQRWFMGLIAVSIVSLIATLARTFW